MVEIKPKLRQANNKKDDNNASDEENRPNKEPPSEEETSVRKVVKGVRKIQPEMKLPTLLDSSKSTSIELNPTTTTTSTRKRVKGVRKNKPLEMTEEEKAQGPFFAYLMIQLGGTCKNEAKLIVTREIYEDAYRHNSGEINDKGTKAAKGRWSPDIAAGPFDTWQEAHEFKKLCMKDSRGVIPKRERFIELVVNGNLGPKVKCYDKRIVPWDLNNWLAQNEMECLQLPEERLAALYIECVPTLKMYQDSERTVY